MCDLLVDTRHWRVNEALPYNFIKIEALVQLFSCEFSEVFKNTDFIEFLRVTASAIWLFVDFACLLFGSFSIKMFVKFFSFESSVQVTDNLE